MHVRVFTFLVILCALPSVFAIQGVTICGIPYDCDPFVPDGVCPEDYASPSSPGGPLCQTCDLECAAARGETCVACNNNGVCEANLGETCLTCNDCGGPAACPAPILSSFSYVNSTATPVNTIVLTVTGSVASIPGMQGTFAIDANRDGDFTDAGEFSSTSPHSVVVSGLALGTHTFNARVNDSTGKVQTASLTLTLANPLPTITGPDGTGEPIVTTDVGGATCNNLNADFAFRARDNVPNFIVQLDYGDGSALFQDTCPGSFCVYNSSESPQLPHTYSPVQAYSAGITVTEAAPYSRPVSRSLLVNRTAPVEGSPSGTLASTTNVCDCASNSCAYTNASGMYCFAATACAPNGMICAGGTTPPTFVDRDTSQATCETTGAGDTCTQYTWGNTPNSAWSASNQFCVGDDAGENLNIQPSFPATARTSCPNAGMCYTTVGTQSCVTPATENTEALCSDGIDNNCDGVVDRDSASCNTGTISGRIRFRDESGVRDAPTRITDQGVEVVDTSRFVFTIHGSPVQPNELVLCPYEPGSTTEGNAQSPRAVCYTIPSGRSGANVAMVTAAPGYEPQIRTYTSRVGESIENFDFTLSPTICNSDCTNSQGFCDRACIGIGACNPTSEEQRTLDACHPQGAVYGLRAGQEVLLSYDAETNMALVGLCCSVVPIERSAPRSAASANPSFGKIDTLVRYTSTVIINGRPYKLVINTW